MAAFMDRRKMKRGKHPDEGRGGLDLIEEAAHLVRSAPATTLAAYYAGTVPFVVGFLYFWADMEKNPFAADHLAEGALAVTGLFFWMKFCQASFARRIRAHLSAKPVSPWGFRQSIRVFFSQALIHSSGLFIVPISLVLMAPFAWVYAFYQSATALADVESWENAKQVRKAGKQASLWVWQNHIVVGLGLLLSLCIFLNWTLVAVFLPYMVKVLFGIETTFSRNPIAMLNTTFFGGVLALTYLCTDPIMKGAYVLRCFYGESLLSGEDLRADLKHFQVARLLVLGLFVFSPVLVARHVYAAAQEAPISVEAPRTSPEELDRQIEAVINQPKYTWRLPKGTLVQDDRHTGVIARFMETVARVARNAIRGVFRWTEELLRRLFGSMDGSGGQSLFGWMRPSLLLYLLLGVVLVALGVFLLRNRRMRMVVPTVMSAPIDNVPNITDEGISADQLPEDGWITLARNLLEQGDLRLAIRAFYLATLAHLARRGLVQIARFKSNRDYESELRRRSHSVPGLLDLFGENLFVFERIWYGLHAIDKESVLRFADNVNRIRTAA
jgi:hypothetical protein